MNQLPRRLSPGEKEFFETLFRRFDEAGIVHIFLRNYEKFPEEMGNDLDVFFPRRDFRKAARLLAKLVRESGGELLHVQELDHVLAVWFRVGAGEPLPVHLDFFHGAFTWHGLTFLDDDELIAASRPCGSVKVPRPAHEALSLVLGSLLWGGFYKARYGAQIRSLLTPPAEAEEFHRLWDRTFGRDTRPAFLIGSEQLPGASQQQCYARRLRRALKRHSFLHGPLKTIRLLCRYWITEFRTLADPPALHVAITGVDGAGKSTVIAAVKPRVDYFFGEIVDRHWRPEVLPELGVAFGRRQKKTGPETNPHGQAPHSVIASLIRFIYYWLDYWIGFPFRIWRPKAKNFLVLFDRYAADMWCDPRRFRLRLPTGLLRAFCRCVPRPDLMFVLLADPEIIHRRKAEVPVETVRELLPRYAEAAKECSWTQAIDCNRSVDQIADEIAARLLDCVRSRAKRYHLFQ